MFSKNKRKKNTTKYCNFSQFFHILIQNECYSFVSFLLEISAFKKLFICLFQNLENLGSQKKKKKNSRYHGNGNTSWFPPDLIFLVPMSRRGIKEFLLSAREGLLYARRTGGTCFLCNSQRTSLFERATACSSRIEHEHLLPLFPIDRTESSGLDWKIRVAFASQIRLDKINKRYKVQENQGVTKESEFFRRFIRVDLQRTLKIWFCERNKEYQVEISFFLFG